MPVLFAILLAVLLPVLEGERVCGEEAGLYQEVHKMDPRQKGARAGDDGGSVERPHSGPDPALLVRAASDQRADQVPYQP